MATIEEYKPDPVPVDASPSIRSYLDRELNRIAARVNSEGLYVSVLGAAPARPSDGLIVYADGVNWNPGSGAGFYGYEAGLWVKL